MRVTPKQWAAAFVDSSASLSGKALQSATKVFVETLAEHGALHRWREIMRAVDDVWRERFGAANVTIETAYPLDAEQRAQLEKVAKGATIRERVNPDLIGGARVRLDDRLIDSTVSGALERLRTALSE